MKQILCIGEILLRLSPGAHGSWLKDNTMPVFMGGAELNVATALALWQHPVKYFTAMPDNGISRDIAAYLAEKNIDTSPVQYAGDRIGLYYLQQGTDMKGAGTVFDRKHSSFATLPTGVVNWHTILDDVAWLHFSAIVPGLSESAVALCTEALQAAKAKGVFISCDLNYRALLWKYGKAPVAIMPSLLQYCNLVMGNIWSANTLLGIPLQEKLLAQNNQQSYLEHATFTANAIMQQYTGCRTVANTFRFDAGSGIHYYASLNTAAGQWVSPMMQTATVIDKVGSGDCFMAGLIHGTLSGYPEQDIISYAATAAFAKLQEKGDTTSNTTETIHQLMLQYG